MTLTGKAKEDFEKYLMSLGCDEYYIIRLSNEEKEYYTIQFLDSVGIYIFTRIADGLKNGFNWSIVSSKYLQYGITNYAHYFKRHKAIAEAIKQANKIYNEKTK